MERYDIGTGNKGQCIVLNITVFHGPHEERDGQEGFILSKLFSSLGFTTTLVAGDVPADRVIQEMKRITDWITDADSLLVVCLMSHGERGSIISSDETKVELQEIIEIFRNKNCPALKGKPRLFFIEACQEDVGKGTEKEEKEADDNDEDDEEDDDDEEEGCNATWDYKCDLPADFLLSFGTPPGYVCWWREDKGSPYISALVRALHKCTDEADNGGQRGADITPLLTMVGSEVGLQVDLTDAESERIMKQMPCYVSTLTKRLFLPKED